MHRRHLTSPKLPEVYCHCIGNDFRMNPKLTVTSHHGGDGNTVWYLGGDVAENGVKLNDDQHLVAVQNLLQHLFPQVDYSNAEWGCFDINRAENQADKNHRPDNPFLRSENGFFVCWPTKLTLTPALGDAMENLLNDEKVSPRTLESNEIDDSLKSLSTILKPAKAGTARWE